MKTISQLIQEGVLAPDTEVLGLTSETVSNQPTVVITVKSASPQQAAATAARGGGTWTGTGVLAQPTGTAASGNAAP